MKRFKDIVMSSKAPDINSIWIDKGDIKYFGENGWASLDTDPKRLPWDHIDNKPNFATVATSGSYNDLLNKPALKAVATSGSYNDLTNKPAAYVLPASTASALGGIKIGFTQANKNYPVLLDGTLKAYVTVPWTDTVYTLPAATTAALGGVKKTPAIADLAVGADAATIVTKVNDLLAALRTAGIITA